jgi:hypothetical protein
MTSEQNAQPQGWGVPLLFIVGFAIGVGITFVGVRDLMRMSSLGDDAITVDARITDTRVMTSRKRGDSYEVRYAFEVAGRSYSYNDSTGRTDLWVPLEKEAWERARADAKTPVQYLPADPWNNRPVHHASGGIFDRVAGIVVGFFCMVPALLWAFAGIKRFRTRKA